MSVLEKMAEFDKKVSAMQVEQESNRKAREYISTQIDKVNALLKAKDKDYEICKDAIEVLRQVSDQSVVQSYKFISDSVNAALSRIFKQERKIELRESMRGNHPQLDIILHVENNKERSLKLNTGRGLTQIVSFLSILSIIVITKSRRLVVIDEILSGLSGESREIMDFVMWNFTEIGFQFIINEHGFIPKGAHVYNLQNIDGVGSVAKDYIEPNGIYLDFSNDVDNTEVPFENVQYVEHVPEDTQTLTPKNIDSIGVDGGVFTI